LLNADKHHNLQKDGFTFLPKIFNEDHLTSAREGLWRIINGQYDTGVEPEARFWNPGDDPSKIIKIDKPHLCDTKVWDLVTNKSFGMALANETRSKTIQVWHTQVVWKPKSKNKSGNAGWHRDAQYWPFWSTSGLFTAWIALSDVSLSSGPVRFISESNKWEDVPGLDFFNKNLAAQDKILKKHHGKTNVVNGLLKMGQISVHSSLTYHSSAANLEKDPRIGMVVHFCTDKAKTIPVDGENSHYLDQLLNQERAPFIYKN